MVEMGEYWWREVGGCIPQVLGRAALLETKCDRNVAVALENKSFWGKKEVVPDRNNKAGNNRNLIKVSKERITKIQQDNKIIKEDKALYGTSYQSM